MPISTQPALTNRRPNNKENTPRTPWVGIPTHPVQQNHIHDKLKTSDIVNPETLEIKETPARFLIQVG